MTSLSGSSYTSDFYSENDEMQRTEEFLKAALSSGEKEKKLKIPSKNTLSSLSYSETSNSVISWISQSTANPFLPVLAPPIPSQKSKKMPAKNPLKLPPIIRTAAKVPRKVIPIPTVLENLALDESIELEIRESALENPLCPRSTIHTILKNASQKSLIAAAVKNRNCSAALIQSILNTEKYFHVLNGAISSSKVISSFLEATAYGTVFTNPEVKGGFNSVVRITALKNPTCPIRVCEAIWNSKAPPHIRSAALEGIPHLTPLEINKIVYGKYPLSIRIAALGHLKCPKSTLRSVALGSNEPASIRSAAAANKNSSPHTLEFLNSSSVDQKIHIAVVGNLNCPLAIVRQSATNHSDPFVQASAIQNLKCPDSIRQEILHQRSNSPILRAAAAKSLGSM